jgi:hypothetical protein
MDFLEFMRTDGWKSLPQGLKAKELDPLMSGLKPGPTQPRSSHQTLKPKYLREKPAEFPRAQGMIKGHFERAGDALTGRSLCPQGGPGRQGKGRRFTSDVNKIVDDGSLL